MAITLENSSTLQIICLNLLNLAMIIYQGQFDPLITRLKNRIEKCNEFLVMMCSLHLMLYTEWVADAQVRYYYGWSNVAVIIVCCTINMLIVLWFSFRVIGLILVKYFKLINYKVKVQIKKIKLRYEEY
jgi:hypothetical protein